MSFYFHLPDILQNELETQFKLLDKKMMKGVMAIMKLSNLLILFHCINNIVQIFAAYFQNIQTNAYLFEVHNKEVSEESV